MQKNLTAEERIKAYNEAILSVRDKVEQWLTDANIKFKIQTADVTLDEERSGSYQTRGFSLVVNGKRISFNPKGSWLIAADGRVDVIGPSGSEMLVHLDDGEWYWCDRNDRRKLQKLSKEILQAVLEQIAGIK